MALPNIILTYPFVLLTQTTSVTGIIPLGSNIRFGYVVMVYDTSDNIAVGQYVMFDISKSQEFIYGSTIYNLVSADFVTGQDVPLS